MSEQGKNFRDSLKHNPRLFNPNPALWKDKTPDTTQYYYPEQIRYDGQYSEEDKYDPNQDKNEER